MTYQIVFTGELRPGYDRRQGIQYLSQRFQLRFDRIKLLLSGGRRVVKEVETREAGEALVDLFWNGGWVTELLNRPETKNEASAAVAEGTPVDSEKDERLYGSCARGAVTCSVLKPEHWQVCTELNPDALIQAGDAGNNRFLVVLRQPKSELSQSVELAEYCGAQLHQCMGKVMQGHRIRAVERYPDAGFPLYTGEFGAVVSNTNIQYLVAASEDGASFYTHILWCEQGNFDLARPVFLRVLQSFLVESRAEIRAVEPQQPVEA